jgi:hypothetical protein
MVFDPYSTIIFIISIILIGLLIAFSTTFLFLIVGQIASWKAQILILVVSCIALFWIIFPFYNQGNYLLYSFSLICGFILNCLLILLPFPLFERKLQRISLMYAVFIGAFITRLGMGFFASRVIDDQFFLSQLLGIPFVLFPGGIVIISMLVFAGITVISRVLFKASAEDHNIQTPELIQTSHKPEKSNILEFTLFFLIIIITPFFGIFAPGLLSGSATGYVSITKINESIVPTGTIYHLSEKNFEEFPLLAPVIRDNTRGDGIQYGITLYGEEREKFIKNFPVVSTNRTTGKSETYFEYHGKFYSFFPPFME